MWDLCSRVAQTGPFHTAPSSYHDTEMASAGVGTTPLESTAVCFDERFSISSKTLPSLLHLVTLDLEGRICLPLQCQTHGERRGGLILPWMLLSHGLVLTMQGNPTQTVPFGVLLGLLPFKTKRADFLGQEDV